MRRFFALLLLIGGLASLSFTTNNHQLFPTALRVTVLNKLGNPVEKAQVTLYANSDDYENGENAVAGPELTDDRGRIVFKDLETKSYYVEAKKGDMSNYGGGEKTNTLQKGKVNKVNIVISND